MPKPMLVRNIPDKISNWIEKERRQYKMSQREFVLDVLEKFQHEKAPELAAKAPVVQYISSQQQLPFKFIDLFAGIGGFRIAMERLGGKCVYTSEWDKYSQKTYKAWFNEVPQGDIRKINPADIPDHDVLCAGFPCQPFSIAGVSKKKSLGREHGFKDNIQGNLFFYLATIIGAKRPPVLFLENVKNLKSHDKGRTWEVIRNTLENLGYKVFVKIIDASDYVPQHRERIIIIGFDKKVFGENPPFEYPEAQENKPVLSSILDSKPDKKYTLTEHLWKYLQQYAAKHKAKGNGFGYGLASPNGITRTLSARYYKDGSEILIPQGKNKVPRRLSPRECARLMGFPDSYKIVVSDTQAYRQFGNAVVVPVIEAVGKKVLEVMSWQLTAKQNGCLLKKTESAIIKVK